MSRKDKINAIRWYSKFDMGVSTGFFLGLPGIFDPPWKLVIPLPEGEQYPCPPRSNILSAARKPCKIFLYSLQGYEPVPLLKSPLGMYPQGSSGEDIPGPEGP